MSEDRARILNMLAEGKINAEEAERLLDALDSRTAAEAPAATAASLPYKGDPAPLLNALPKYLHVKVDGNEGEKVDVKVPLALVRSGLKLTSLIPPQAMAEINEQMTDKGISIDFTNLKPEDIDELIEALREMEINIDGKDGETVRVYAE
jgi:Asp-tRNA(Asn)/Glu-tRNA(Gln) amidotransferase B subunit